MGQVEFLAPTQASTFTTDGQVAVQIRMTQPLAAGDNDFKLRLRLCKAIFSGCFDEFQIVPVEALNALVQWTDKSQPLTASFPASTSWESSDKYLITIESTTTSFRAKSAKFEITNTEGSIRIQRPVPNTALNFEQRSEVKIAVMNVIGDDVGYQIQVVDGAGNVVYNGPPSSGTTIELIPEESWGPPGAYTLRVLLTSNPDIAGEVSVTLRHPSAYFTIREPTSSASYQAGGAIFVSWEAVAVQTAASVELYEGQSVIANLGQGDGSLEATLPNELQSGFGFRLRIAGVANDGSQIEAFSEPFQIQGSNPVGGGQGSGLCSFNETNTRHAICTSPDGRPLMQQGNEFAIFEIQFLWQTCVSLHGTTLDVLIKYTNANGEMKIDGQDNHNFLPDDGDKLITVLNGKSSPYYLQVIMENVVKGEKQLEPFPGTWQFSTDLYISPFQPDVAGRSRMPVAFGLTFTAPNPDCRDSPTADPNIPPGCTEDTANGCEPTVPAAQDLFPAQTELCSSHAIGALNEPCGDTQVFVRERRSEKLIALTGTGEYCGGTFYVEVQSKLETSRRGWVPTSAIGECPRPCNPPQCMKNGQCVVCDDETAAGTLSTALPLALTTVGVMCM